MKRILLITNRFPFLPGEEFLETEIKYFAKNKNFQLTILPARTGNQKRVIDASIEVDNYLTLLSIHTKKRKLSDFVSFLLREEFYKERSLFNSFNIIKLKSFIGMINTYKKYYNAFDNYFKDKKNVNNLVVYTYWNNEATYALESLKDKYGYQLVSRIHGFDLYKEVWPSSYMPLKGQFGKKIDRIFTITQSANSYLNKTYGINQDIIEMSRLGIDNHGITSLPNKKDILHIISCSSLTHIKRVDKIINTLRILSLKETSINYIWTHIGTGNLHQEIFNMAKKMLGDLPNIKFTFKGNIDNKDVYQFYKNNKIDVFINVSESEGVPVSIMEAMSCHVPVIAPNIGGISDLVIDGVNGFLLSNNCRINEILDALKKNEIYKKNEIRNNSFQIYLERFHAKKNYTFFLNTIENL